jgi:hypothetical protein
MRNFRRFFRVFSLDKTHLEGCYRSSIDGSHYWGLYKPAQPTAAPPDEVEVRDLAVYQSLLEGGAL